MVNSVACLVTYYISVVAKWVGASTNDSEAPKEADKEHHLHGQTLEITLPDDCLNQSVKVLKDYGCDKIGLNGIEVSRTTSKVYIYKMSPSITDVPRAT